MKVTDIKYLRSGGCRIYVEEEAVAVIDPSLLHLLCIEKDAEIDEDKLEEIRKQGRAYMARESALRSLSRTDFSRKSLTRRLKQKGIDESSAGEAVLEMVSKAYVDDHKYAKRLVTVFSFEKALGRRRVIAELLQRGIEPETAKQTVEDHAQQDSLNIRRFFASKCGKMDKKKAQGRLLRAGYNWEDIKDVVPEDEDE